MRNGYTGHDISETPEDISKTLYDYRHPYHKEVPFEDYIKLYGVIVVDFDVYYKEEDYWRFIDVRDSHGDSREVRMPDAIFKEGKIIKNRYGNYHRSI